MQEMSRQEANIEIVNLILDAVSQFPDQRFGQILYNIGVATHRKVLSPIFNNSDTNPIFDISYLDIFFEESVDTLERIKPQVDTLEGITDEEGID